MAVDYIEKTCTEGSKRDPAAVDAFVSSKISSYWPKGYTDVSKVKIYAKKFKSSKVNKSKSTVFMHASGPPKRPIAKLLEVKLKSNLYKNYMELKFGAS